MIENIIVKNSDWNNRDIELLFGDGESVEDVHFTEANDMQSLVVELGLFPSKSQATKAGRQGPIPLGWTAEFKASKKRRLWIWNPSP